MGISREFTGIPLAQPHRRERYSGRLGFDAPLLMLEFWFRRCVDSDAANEPLEYAVLKAVA